MVSFIHPGWYRWPKITGSDWRPNSTSSYYDDHNAIMYTPIAVMLVHLFLADDWLVELII